MSPDATVTSDGAASGLEAFEDALSDRNDGAEAFENSLSGSNDGASCLEAFEVSFSVRNDASMRSTRCSSSWKPASKGFGAGCKSRLGIPGPGIAGSLCMKVFDASSSLSSLSVSSSTASARICARAASVSSSTRWSLSGTFLSASSLSGTSVSALSLSGTSLSARACSSRRSILNGSSSRTSATASLTASRVARCMASTISAWLVESFAFRIVSP
mmetsp:Transcript_59471/g.114790  ORF Transcript_59471/g.114790 Transcript_59471/m.114790 type:complete len:216 (+) Transcript_59471:623-1270(+)